MRVIAGSAKGRPLRTLPGRDVRPTSDRVREALFSSLAEVTPGATVLDLFAGSGALGIEALSRGAAAATFVESDPRAAAVIAANLERTGLAGKATVITADASRFCQRPGQAFDLVLVDPPYATPLGEVWATLATLREGGGLTRDATVVIERDRRDPDLASDVPAVLAVERTRRYGDTVLLVCRATTSPKTE